MKVPREWSTAVLCSAIRIRFRQRSRYVVRRPFLRSDPCTACSKGDPGLALETADFAAPPHGETAARTNAGHEHNSIVAAQACHRRRVNPDMTIGHPDAEVARAQISKTAP